jgi:hypothetical protein
MSGGLLLLLLLLDLQLLRLLDRMRQGLLVQEGHHNMAMMMVKILK